MGKSTEPLKTRQYVTAETLTLHNSKVVLKSIVLSAVDVIVAGGEFAFLALLCEIHNDYM